MLSRSDTKILKLQILYYTKRTHYKKIVLNVFLKIDKGHELYQFYYFCKNNKIFITFRFSHDIIMSGDDNLLYHFRLLTVCFKKMGTRVSLQSLNLIFADVMTDRNESLDQRFFREMAKMRNVCLLLMYITARYGLCHSCAKYTFYL